MDEENKYLLAALAAVDICSYLETMEGVPIPVVFVTCNSLRESRVLEFGNFP